MTNQINNQSTIPSTDVIQLDHFDSEDDYRTGCRNFEATVNNNSPIQDYVHSDDQTQPAFEMTPGFKTFTINYLTWVTTSQQLLERV